MRCQDTYLCTKNRHRVYYVENPVDNHFSLWITLYHIVFNTTSLGVLCPLSDRHDRGRDRAGQIGRTEGRDRGRNSQKIGAQHDGKNFFCALFLIFSKNFSALKTPVFTCFRLFCEPLRARAFSLSLKKTAEIFFSKTVDRDSTPRYNGYCQEGQHPDSPPHTAGATVPHAGGCYSLTGTVPTV